MIQNIDKCLFVGKIVSTYDNILVFFIVKNNDKYEVYSPSSNSIMIVDSIKLIDNEEDVSKKKFFITAYQPALNMEVQFQNKPYVVVSIFNYKNQIEPIIKLISKKSIEVIDIPLGLLLCNRTI